MRDRLLTKYVNILAYVDNSFPLLFFFVFICSSELIKGVYIWFVCPHIQLLLRLFIFLLEFLRIEITAVQARLFSPIFRYAFSSIVHFVRSFVWRTTLEEMSLKAKRHLTKHLRRGGERKEEKETQQSARSFEHLFLVRATSKTKKTVKDYHPRGLLLVDEPHRQIFTLDFRKQMFHRLTSRRSSEKWFFSMGAGTAGGGRLERLFLACFPYRA